MKYISTAGKSTQRSFRESVLENLPGDGGLFFPTEIPRLDEFLSSMASLSLPEIAEHVLFPFCEGDLSREELRAITQKVFNFPIPITEVEKGIHCLELFHGPTFAFKDVGAKFLAECLARFNTSSNRETTVLVATSGDTGGAVANGFLGVEGVKVVILYPKGKVSSLQEKQLTTLGQNITALEVSGTFDDCQNMVKAAFNDKDLNQSITLSSANSINIARWLPQSLFYLIPLQFGFEDVVISVPSGNYGNLTSGALAMKMGVPIRQFIAASNANDVVPRYLETGDYKPRPTIPTIANAMDVSDPSNFDRLLSLFEGNYDSIKSCLKPYSLKDGAISDTILKCYEENEYLLDPHSAIAYQALKQNDPEGIFLGTAHHCKFLPTIEEALKKEIPIPNFAQGLLTKKKEAVSMEVDYKRFKEFLKS